MFKTDCFFCVKVFFWCMNSFSDRLLLADGQRMPWLGLGTWKLQGKSCEQAVLWALEAGYRLIDTAAIYGNEESVGKAIHQSGIPREELFITTKLWNNDFYQPEKALQRSLERLDLDYVDLFLLHWPEKQRVSAWKRLEELNKNGKARSIGVSNFSIRHLEELLSQTEIVPVINQAEFSPFLFQKELLAYCIERKIQLEAYSPLTRSKKLLDRRLVELARKYRKSPAQVLLRWCLQHGVCTIPKTAQKERLLENKNVFDFLIAEKDMQEMNGWNENLRNTWDPETFP